YFSNQIQINFNVNTNAPTIEYPTEGTIIQSEKLSLRGTSKANTKVFIFESAPSSNSSILIGSTTSNGLGQWSFTLPIKTTKSTYFHVRTEEVAGEISSGLPSNELKLNLQRSPFASFIETPKNFETIQTKHLQISGTGTKNAVVKILKASNTNPVFQVIETTTTNENGKWSKIITSPTNDNYLLAAIVSTNNYKSTSNIISIQTNYAFSQKALSIDQPKTNSTTHKKRIKVQGKAPNGILNIHLDDQFNKAITVTQNLWNTFIELPNESTFKVQASSSHNTLIKFSNIIKITRNSKPKITETSEKLIKNKTFKLKGTGKEGIILTITIKENSFNYLTGINPMAGAQEKVVGQVLTDIDGNWEIEIPIQSSGTYIFKVYESYNNVAEVTSETYTYDLAMASNEVNLNIAPNPFNPTKSSLKIQYELPEPLNVDIKIYTLTGEIVYSKSFISNEIGGTSGRHIIEWNGQYDNGFIFPGLYVVLLQTSGNQNELKTKRLGVKW
ncbi:MAG: T9SS type A sorting domain-containing protein, partial [Candidatus Margulisiibacteriota bacterium]